MPPKKIQVTEEYDDDLETNDILGDDSNAMEIKYNIHSIHSTELQLLLGFLNDNVATVVKDPRSNIVDMFSGKTFIIPENKITIFLNQLEKCRRAGITCMMSEKQNADYSGIMLDFDIKQKVANSMVDTKLLITLCNKIFALLISIIDFKEVKKDTFHVGIIKKPKPKFTDDSYFKDGFHILIPGIKINRNVKRFIIKKITESEILDQVFEDIEPYDNIKKNSFLDPNSGHVNVYFIGNASKKGSDAYLFTNIFEASVNISAKDVVIQDVTYLKETIKNVCHEFSLNYERENGLIKKRNYEILDKYAKEIIKPDPIIPNLQHNNVDITYNEVSELINILNPIRADNYDTWFNVLCVIANISTNYKNLAEIFSKKSKKFNQNDFDRYWLNAITGSNKKKKLTIASLKYWAKLDNPIMYDSYIKNNVYNIITNIIVQAHIRGILNHSDISKILYTILKDKYITSYPEGEKKIVWFEFILESDDYSEGQLYKWKRWKDEPISLLLYISNILPGIFKASYDKIARIGDKGSPEIAKYYNEIKKNFAATIRNLGNHSFKKNVINEASLLFHREGFANELDSDPLIRGVSNGILKLSNLKDGKPELITGYHTYSVSKFTKVKYIPFDPFDEITKKLIISLRRLFPDDEPDTFEFVMYYLASTIDSLPKESVFLQMIGGGSNGKSFLMELHIAAIGELYGKKLPMSILTTKNSNPDNATPILMQLKDASFAYCSENNDGEVLNVARIKEITGMETISGRKLHQDVINFKPKCHIMVISNYKFKIECNDHGTWRRIEYVPLKITFVPEHLVEKNKLSANQRIADPVLINEWKENPEIQGRYLGYLVYLHYLLNHDERYQGKVLRVPHKHVEYETMMYRNSQNTISEFINKRLVKTKDPETKYPMSDEIKKYIIWYSEMNNIKIPEKDILEQFKNSEIEKYIVFDKSNRGYYIKGHRFLPNNNSELMDGEEFFNEECIPVVSDNFGIKPETPEEFYDNTCNKYETLKHLFVDKEFNIIPEKINKMDFGKMDFGITRNFEPYDMKTDMKTETKMDMKMDKKNKDEACSSKDNIKVDEDYDISEFLNLDINHEDSDSDVSF
jgi:hypothetical protein